MRKYLSIIVVPHDDSNVRNFRVSYRMLVALTVLVSLSLLTGTFFVATYGKALVEAYQAAGLAAENKQLRTRNAQIDSLRTELVRLQTTGIQIKKMLGVGLSIEDSMLVANLSPVVYSPAISQAGGISEAERTEQQLLLKAIPSLWPLKGYVTREFYTTGGEKSDLYHPGMDIAARRNTPVQTSAEGIVVSNGWDETFGYQVAIDHGFGIQTLYGHNSRNIVQEGDRVVRGQTIAFVGDTGKSSAPHLHFEVKKNGVPVDPRNYLLN
ncbi:MAG: M23 family metallopeptidase [Candidatus Krumholzibacteria bacterium]